MEASEIRLTFDDVMSWHPCVEYTADRIRALFSDRESVCMDEILEEVLKLPKHDVLWFLLREPFVSEEQLFSLAEKYAHHAMWSPPMMGCVLHPDSAYAQQLALMASKGKFVDEHFKGFNNPDLENWANHMSVGTKAAMLTALWSVRTVGTQVANNDLNKLPYVDAERTYQIDELLNVIGMRKQVNDEIMELLDRRRQENG